MATSPKTHRAIKDLRTPEAASPLMIIWTPEALLPQVTLTIGRISRIRRIGRIRPLAAVYPASRQEYNVRER